jgi:Cys-tRNA(Pro)/Cys-tRNA(Cys) deacylase
MVKKPPSTPATVLLTTLGCKWIGHTYDHDPNERNFGLEAAEKLGIAVERVFKTLIVAVDGHGLTVAIVPVASKVDLKAVAQSVGGKRAEMADPTSAERSSGYVLGGISPFGQRKPLPTILDQSAEGFSTILVSGGRRGFDVELSPADLLRATEGTMAPIAATHD